MPIGLAFLGIVAAFAIFYLYTSRRDLRKIFVMKGHEILNSDECSAEVASIVEAITNIIDIDGKDNDCKVDLLRMQFSDLDCNLFTTPEMQSNINDLFRIAYEILKEDARSVSRV